MIDFDTPPAIPLWKVAARRPTFAGSIPRVEARAARLAGDPAAYSRVCGFPVADTLPVTFPDVLARGLQLAVLSAPAFPVPALGILHVRQRIEQRRPLRAGEALAGRVWVEGHRVVRKGGEFDMHTVVSAGGEDVWHGVTTILSKAIPGDGEKRPHPQPASFLRRRSVCWRLPPDQGRRYAAVSGDANPIHLWGITARLFGFRRPIAHGWWALARALAEMDTDVPGACVVEARFASPLPLPGSCTFESGPAADGHRFEIRGRDTCVEGRVIDT
ncbi:MAG: MaoC/PaaZ C-terminal domain-containing protein [Myxococcota bacterium]